MGFSIGKHKRDLNRELKFRESVRRKSLKLGKARPVHPKFFKLIEPKAVHLMRKMQTNEYRMARWERKRILTSILILLLILLASNFAGSYRLYVLIAAPALAVFIYVQQGYNLKKIYSRYVFRRQLAFSKFARLLVTYLRQVVNGESILRVFGKLRQRMDSKADKQLLDRLINESRDDPMSDEPYQNFAKRFSGDPSAMVFMEAVDNLRKTGVDGGVIAGLAKQIDEDILKKMIEIRQMKMRKFRFVNTAIVAMGMLMMGGMLGALVVAEVSSLMSGLHF